MWFFQWRKGGRGLWLRFPGIGAAHERLTWMPKSSTSLTIGCSRRACWLAELLNPGRRNRDRHLVIVCYPPFDTPLTLTMPYLTKDEVLAMLMERRDAEVVEQHLIAGLPYVFREAPRAFQDFAETLSRQFRTPIEDVSVIGSGRIGFSLDPDKFGTPFHARSDLDVIVVNPEMFDLAWIQLCRVGRRRLSLDPRVKSAFEVHRANNVFFGFIVPEALPGILTISTLWFNVFRQIGFGIRVLAGRKVTGRLYRTWEHVRVHQRYSLDAVATKFGR